MPSQRFSMLARVGLEIAWSEAARVCKAFTEATGAARMVAVLRGTARETVRRNIVRQAGGGETTSKSGSIGDNIEVLRLIEPGHTPGHGLGESGGGSWMEKDLKTFLVV